MLAALGGMVLPALIFTAIAGGKGWGVVIASDTAFVLGVLALIGRRCPLRLRVFMLTLMIGDDIVRAPRHRRRLHTLTWRSAGWRWR